MSFADVHQLRDHIRDRMGGGSGDAGAPVRPFIRPYAWRPASEIPPRDFVYGRHLIRKFTSATFAPGGFGKSNLIMVEMMACASGKALLGIQPPVRLRTAFWNGEDPLEETERRVAGAAMHFGLQASDLEGWFFWGSGRDDAVVIAEQTSDGAQILRPNIERLKEAIREAKLDILAIDPFVSCHRVTENDNNTIDTVAKEWGKVAEETNIAVELSHHTTKAAIGRDVRVEDGRGGGALLFAVRSARVLNVMNDDEAKAAGVEPDRRRFYFRVDNGKANLSPPASKSSWHHFASVDLGNASGVKPSDSVGVVEAWDWPGAAPEVVTLNGRTFERGKLRHRAKVILAAYWRMIDEGRGVPAPPALGVPPGQLAVRDDELRAQAGRMNLVIEPRPEKTDLDGVKRWQSAARNAWKGGVEELQDKKRLRFEDGLVWDVTKDRGVIDED